jgi:hypothetical protein
LKLGRGFYFKLSKIKENTMSRYIVAVLTALALVVAGIGTVSAQGLPWSDHSPPFSFLFGNHIDMHQQSKTLGNGGLQGFFYIHFTGEAVNGIPVAMHGQDSVGWVIDGAPASVRLVSKMPPTWCVDPGQMPKAPGYTHFHWVGLPEMPADFVVGDI